MEETVERIEEKLDVSLTKHERLLFGDHNTPGLIIELDRIKQSHIRQDHAYRWVAGVLATIVSGLILWQFRA